MTKKIMNLDDQHVGSGWSKQVAHLTQHELRHGPPLTSCSSFDEVEGYWRRGTATFGELNEWEMSNRMTDGRLTDLLADKYKRADVNEVVQALKAERERVEELEAWARQFPDDFLKRTAYPKAALEGENNDE
jgi:hypothetical protein